jgi:Putative prokaryotic signal transducing protein
MEKDWIQVFSARQSYTAELVKGMLKENNISSIILNRQDSEFLVGEVQVYVHEENAKKASELIQEAGMA